MNRRRRRPGTALVALAVLTIALCTLLSSGPSPTAHASPAATSPATGPDARAPTYRTDPTDTDPDAENAGLRLTVDSMSPRVITETGPNMLTVTGSLVNGGDQPVSNVEIRVQLSQRLRTEGDIRTALAGDVEDDAVTPGFVKLSAELAPGASVPVRFTVPVRGPASSSLALQHSGIYELLLNVNGTPADGDQARLVGVRVLLPALGLPGSDGYPAVPSAAPTAGRARPVSVLYPLSDQPRRLPTGPGDPVQLADDLLAGELGKGGRLSGMLDALDTSAPVGSPTRSAICLAVDPDLLRTVQDMAGGYQVRAPDGAVTDGRGAAAATDWLNRLRAEAVGRCVVAMPFADADLVALSRAGLPDLTGYATVEGAKIAATILGTPVRSDLTWPADGLLDERSLNDYARAGGHTVLLSEDAVSDSAKESAGIVRLATPDATSTGVLTDPLVTLAATGANGGQSGLLASALAAGHTGLGSLAGSAPLSPANGGGTLSAQDAIGAIAYRALSSSRGNPLVVAPPHQWNTSRADAGALLDSISSLVTAGRLAPASLPGADGAGVVPSSDNTATASLVYPLRAGAREVPTAATAQLRIDRDTSAALRSAAVPAQGIGTTPAQVFDPVTQGLLRGASAVWRGHPSLAAGATKVITDRVNLMRSLVHVVEPATPYALGDAEAPLPLTLSNGLPVAMRVRVSLAGTPGLKITSITPDPAERPIPPLGRLQLRASTQLTRSGQFSVEARLTTPDGAPLGLPSRLVLRSTAYGTITLWLTGTAGVLLVILAVRRIVRRLRGSTNTTRPDPETLDETAGDPTLARTVSNDSADPSGRTKPSSAAEGPTGDPKPQNGPTRRSAHRRGGTQPSHRDPVARRLGAEAREEDEAAIRRGRETHDPEPTPARQVPSHQTPAKAGRSARAMPASWSANNRPPQTGTPAGGPGPSPTGRPAGPAGQPARSATPPLHRPATRPDQPPVPPVHRPGQPTPRRGQPAVPPNPPPAYPRQQPFRPGQRNPPPRQQPPPQQPAPQQPPSARRIGTIPPSAPTPEATTPTAPTPPPVRKPTGKPGVSPPEKPGPTQREPDRQGHRSAPDATQPVHPTTR